MRHPVSVRMMASVAVLFGAGCSEPAVDGLNPDIEGQVTIQQGIYGQLGMASDAGHVHDRAYPSAQIDAYVGTTAVASAVSDADGFYELALAPGFYELCTLNAPLETPDDIRGHFGSSHCLFIDLRVDVVRRDWRSSIEGGWWSEGP